MILDETIMQPFILFVNLLCVVLSLTPAISFKGIPAAIPNLIVGAQSKMTPGALEMSNKEDMKTQKLTTGASEGQIYGGEKQ